MQQMAGSLELYKGKNHREAGPRAEKAGIFGETLALLKAQLSLVEGLNNF